MLDDQALKSEIDEISKRIDQIIKTVNQFYPEHPQESPIPSTEEATRESFIETHKSLAPEALIRRQNGFNKKQNH